MKDMVLYAVLGIVSGVFCAVYFINDRHKWLRQSAMFLPSGVILGSWVYNISDANKSTQIALYLLLLILSFLAVVYISVKAHQKDGMTLYYFLLGKNDFLSLANKQNEIMKQEQNLAMKRDELESRQKLIRENEQAMSEQLRECVHLIISSENPVPVTQTIIS